MANTFRKIYKKTGSSGTSSDYTLVGNVGVNGVELDIMQGASSSADGEIGLVPKPSKDDYNFFLKANGIWDCIYPVGSIYFSVKNTNPSKYFGGTWVSWGSGRVPVGVNSSDSSFNTVEKTGGESKHKLTVNEIPAHSHRLNIYTNMVSDAPLKYAPTTGKCNTQSSTYETGGGQSHNNLQPYITCYMWKRTA